MTGKTISELVMEYFYAHPNEDLEHGPVVDWVTEQWLKSHDTPPRDPWRVIRALHQKGVGGREKNREERCSPSCVRRSEEKQWFPTTPERLRFKWHNEPSNRLADYRCVWSGPRLGSLQGDSRCHCEWPFDANALRVGVCVGRGDCFSRRMGAGVLGNRYIASADPQTAVSPSSGRNDGNGAARIAV
jgi:hypothetical protein